MNEEARKELGRILDDLKAKFDQNDLVGLAVVSVDSGYQLTTSASVDEAPTFTQLVAGMRVLEFRIISGTFEARASQQKENET